MSVLSFLAGILILIETGGLAQQYPIAYQYLLIDLDRCKTESPDVLIWVQGRATSKLTRSMIRETFGNQKLWPGGLKVTTVFFMGRLGEVNESFAPLLNYEFEMYRDIVQNDYIENYKNQTFKLMSAINYITDHCSDLKLILRIDDDVVFHPALMLSKLIDVLSALPTNIDQEAFPVESRLSNLPAKTVACKLISNYAVWRKADHPKHFNAVDETVLPGEKLYPPFCAGFFIAMTGDVPALLRPYIATNTPFWMDDRYMGILQKRSSTRNMDVGERLDFGYHHVTAEGLGAVITGQIFARHLPANLHNHITYVYEYLTLASVGLKGHFGQIKYVK